MDTTEYMREKKRIEKFKKLTDDLETLREYMSETTGGEVKTYTNNFYLCVAHKDNPTSKKVVGVFTPPELRAMVNKKINEIEAEIEKV